MPRRPPSGWVFEAYSWDDYVVDSDARLAREHAGLLGLPLVRRPLASPWRREPVVRVQFVVPVAGATAALAAPAGTAGSAATSPIMPGAVFVSITVDGVSKAAGVRAVAEDLGVGVERVMMVGGSLTTCRPSRPWGGGLAMGNAEAEVIAASRFVVGHVDDDGAASDRPSALLG